MAFAEKLGSGRYRGGYSDSSRKRRYVKGTFVRRKDALNAAQEAEVKARRRASAASGTLPGSTEYGQWWELLSVDRIFESDTGSTQRYNYANHIEPRWGHVALNEIKRTEVNSWVKRDLVPNFAPSTVLTIYGLFAVVINAAVAAGILDASPLVRIELPKVPKKRKSYTTQDQVRLIAEDVRDGAKGESGKAHRGYRRAEPVYADAIEFGFETGMRPGELAGMHFDQIRPGWVTARTVYVPGSGKMRDYPKDKDERDIPLTTRAREIITRRSHGRDVREACGIEHYRNRRCNSALVFALPGGHPLDTKRMTRLMAGAAARAGLPRKTAYDNRRGYGTHLGHNGVDAFSLANVMGHSNVQQTQQYVQEDPAVRARVLAALGDPSATGMHVVESRPGHGTDRGTHPDRQVPTGAGREEGRRTS